MIQKDTKFSPKKRVESFTHAGRGLRLFIKSAHNSWLQLFILFLTILFGIYYGITKYEWLMLVLVSGFVLTAEAFNSAIEIDMDLTSPEYHPFARDTKDVAAGAVLVSAITALVVGLIIFLPYIFN